MNERIKLLAEQAELNATLLFNKDKLEKFAELIVQECAHLTDTLNEAYGAPSTTGKFIKEHFGVKE
jgi:hypothetical protein